MMFGKGGGGPFLKGIAMYFDQPVRYERLVFVLGRIVKEFAREYPDIYTKHRVFLVLVLRNAGFIADFFRRLWSMRPRSSSKTLYLCVPHNGLLEMCVRVRSVKNGGIGGVAVGLAHDLERYATYHVVLDRPVRKNLVEKLEEVLRRRANVS